MKIEDAKYLDGWLMLRTSDADAIRLVYKFKPGDYAIEAAKERRSLDANAYCWVLCTKIGEAVGITKEDVYRDAVKHVGVFKDISGLTPEDAQTMRTAWERLGTGWVTEQVDWEPDGEHVVFRAYYGSSTYNTRRMARLIDWLVQEAQNMGIETDTGRIRALLEEWDEKQKQQAS